MQNCDKWCVALDWFGLLNEGTAKAQDVYCLCTYCCTKTQIRMEEKLHSNFSISVVVFLSFRIHTFCVFFLCLTLHLSLQLKFVVTIREEDTLLCHFFLSFDLLVFVLFVQQ